MDHRFTTDNENIKVGQKDGQKEGLIEAPK